MSTRFYLDIQKKDFPPIELTELSDMVFIGKYSSSWKFLFYANEFEYFRNDKHSVMDFLKSGHIYDEYGEYYTFDEFWDIVVKSNDGYDAETYYKHFPHEDPLRYTIFPIIHNYYISKNGSPMSEVNKYHEFYIDDLRFSVKEFS